MRPGLTRPAIEATEGSISARLDAALGQLKIEDKRGDGLTSQKCIAHAGEQRGSKLPNDGARDGTGG